MINYKFYLHRDSERSARVQAFPIFSDSLSLNYEKENSQMFFRSKLSGSLTFIKTDYDYIMSSRFEDGLIVDIENRQEDGTYAPYWRGRFYKTDCTINEDDRTIIVTPEVLDAYSDILAGLENEYDLIQLEPAIESVRYKKRPLIQIYIGGDNVISNFLGGMNFELDATETDNESELTNKYHFALASKYKEINVSGFVAPPMANGVYYGEIGTYEPWNETYHKDFVSNNGYTLTLECEYNLNIFTKRATIKTPSGVVLATYTNSTRRFEYNFDEDIQFQVQGSGVQGNVKATQRAISIYSRILLDTLKYYNTDTFAIPSDDIVSNNKNYSRCLNVIANVFGMDSFILSANESNEPTKWGKKSNGKYYVQPNQYAVPIAQSKWGGLSIWFNRLVTATGTIENGGTANVEMKDAYHISSVIKILLRQIDTNLSHERTAEYSKFLYGGYGVMVNETINLLITQKTNILSSGYSIPAQTAKTTLSEILAMLKNVYDLHWFIDDNKLRIEHRYFFINGGSYSQEPNVGIDLTELCARNKKPYAFHTSAYTYDKQAMTERYEYKFADEVSEIFIGEPIVMDNRFVQRGKKEEITIGGFTPDIDLMLLNPSAFSEDGFALMNADADADGYILPITFLNYQGLQYKVQNGRLSMVNLQKKYLDMNFPSHTFWMQGNHESTDIIQFGKKQQVTFPIGVNDINPLELVTTNIGNGQIASLQINLSSRNVNAQLQFQTYE